MVVLICFEFDGWVCGYVWFDDVVLCVGCVCYVVEFSDLLSVGVL